MRGGIRYTHKSLAAQQLTLRPEEERGPALIPPPGDLNDQTM